LNDGEGVGVKPCPTQRLDEVRIQGQADSPELKTSRSETASTNTRYTNGKRKGEAHGSHTLF
jgi:hypothetical protein